MIMNLMESVPNGYSIRALSKSSVTGEYCVEIWTGVTPVKWGTGQTIEDAIDQAGAKATVSARGDES